MSNGFSSSLDGFISGTGISNQQNIHYSSGSDNNLGLPISFGFSTNTKDNNIDDDKTFIRGIAMPTNDFNDDSSRSGINNVPSMGVSCRTNDILYKLNSKCYNEQGVSQSVFTPNKWTPLYSKGENKYFMSLIYLKYRNNKCMVVSDGRSTFPDSYGHPIIELETYDKIVHYNNFVIGHTNANRFVSDSTKEYIKFDEFCEELKSKGTFDNSLIHIAKELLRYCNVYSQDTTFILVGYEAGYLYVYSINSNNQRKIEIQDISSQYGFIAFGDPEGTDYIKLKYGENLRHVIHDEKLFLNCSVEEFQYVSDIVNTEKKSPVGNPYIAYSLSKDEIKRIDISPNSIYTETPNDGNQQ